MTKEQLAQAKDKDLPASLIAIRRAARMAREQAVRTDTAIIVIIVGAAREVLRA